MRAVTRHPQMEVAKSIEVEFPRLVITRFDGTLEGETLLNEGETPIGREVGGILGQDSALSKRHATVRLDRGAVVVRDEGGRNGTYVRLPARTDVPLQDGDHFHFGRMFLRFDATGRALASSVEPFPTVRVGDVLGSLTLVMGPEELSGRFPMQVEGGGLYLGRSLGDALFPTEAWVSAAHCKISLVHCSVCLTDLGSSNGTYLRFRGERSLKSGDVLLMGQRLYHIYVP